MHMISREIRGGGGGGTATNLQRRNHTGEVVDRDVLAAVGKGFRKEMGVWSKYLTHHLGSEAASNSRSFVASSHRPPPFPYRTFAWTCALFRKSSFEGDIFARLRLIPSIENFWGVC